MTTNKNTGKNTGTLTKRANRLTRTARVHLLWEAYAPILALGVLCLALYFIGAAFGLWQRIGDPWRLIALITALFFLVKNIIAATRRLKPTVSEAKRRVEHDSGLTHRPLDVLTDTPALGDEDSLEWRTHMSRARGQVENAGRSKLRPSLAPIDKYYLRFAAPLALVLAFMVGAGDNFERVRSGLNPKWTSGMAFKNAHFEAWIDPPTYTNRPPSYFKNSKSMNAPEGSEFVARISGVKTAPRLILREGTRTRRISAKRLGPTSFEARAIVTKDSVAHYRIGTEVQEWILNVGKDQKPTVKFIEPPKAGKRDKLEFTYSLQDDYGVESLTLSYTLKSDLSAIEQSPVPIPGSTVRNAEKEFIALNLTKHKWAGKEVIGHLIAVDGKGQQGLSTAFKFIVPDKIFVEPIAKSAAENRILMLGGTGEYAPMPKVIGDKNAIFAVDHPEMTIRRAPENVQRAALLIEAVTDKPVGVFDDPAVYMGLRNIYRRLQTADAQSELAGIPEDLWEIAIRAEFGLLGDAKEDMMRAERALNNAMARHAPQREIDTLFERYNKAVDRYMEALTLEAIKNAKNQDGQEGGGGGEADFNTDEIQALLDAIEEANRMGDTVAARKALAKLAELLENMQIQMAQGGGSGEGMSDEGMSEEMKEALEELNDLLGEQRQLRDETQKSGRLDSGEQDGNDPNGEQQKSGSELAEQQKSLREMIEALKNAEQQGGSTKDGGEENGSGGGDKDAQAENGGAGGSGGDLQELLKNGKIKDALKEAEDAMARSERALGNEEFYRAGRAQSDAIDALREAGEELFAEEAKRLQDENGEKGQEASGEGQGDPFGRENDKGGVGDKVDIPEKSDRQRARDLLEELRKRSGEQDRDKVERDYLDRLLERF